MLRRFFDRLRLPFRKDRELRSALFRILGFYPQNIDYYKIAFAHKSQALRDKNGKPLNNERLEFLGDAVLESVVSDILFHHFEKRHEGFLTATRSKIVQRESLNRLAKEMGIDQFIQTASRNHSGHSHLGGNAFEALMGAIYLDKGYKTCQKFVKKQILGRLMDLDGVANKEVNFKSKLLEWCQKNKLKQDFVMRLEDNGKQKEPVFHCTVIVESIEFGYGKGFSKKEAQQQAARETLTMLRRDENVVDSVFRSKEKRTAMEANEMAVLPKIDEIEDDLLREQQQAKRPQPAEPRKAERKEQEPKQPVMPQPKEKKEAQPTKEQPQPRKKEPKPEVEVVQKQDTKEQKAQQKAHYEKPAAEPKADKGVEEQKPVSVEQEVAPKEQKVVDAEQPNATAAPVAPQKAKKVANVAPVNLVSVAEAAIAEAEAVVPHLPSVVEPHSTAVVPTPQPRKREIVPAEDYKVQKSEQKAKPTEVAPAVKTPEVAVTTPEPEISATEVPVETPEPAHPETPKKEKRPRHKVTRIAEYTKTEVKSEEEVEAERQRIKEEREEKRRNKRMQREANRAKDELERLTQPQHNDTSNDIFAEVSLGNNTTEAESTAQQKPTGELSNSAKRRLRRKRAAERAQLENEAVKDAPVAVQEVQPEEGNTEKPADRKKHQRGNSRKRRRQQAMSENETTTAPTAAEAE